MKKLWMAMALIAPAALAQTTTTNCQQYGNQLNCTSRTQPPPARVNPNAFSDAYNRAEEAARQQRAADQQRAISQQQAENLRMQNELLRRQLEAANAAESADFDAIGAAWNGLVKREMDRPEADRIPKALLSRMAINEAAQQLGHQPSRASIDEFRRQIGVN